VIELPSLDAAGTFIGGAATTGLLALIIAGYRSLFSDSTKDRAWLRTELNQLRGDIRLIQADLRTCQAEKHEFRVRDQLRQAEIEELRRTLAGYGGAQPPQNAQ
jgi:hypothetical protein